MISDVSLSLMTTVSALPPAPGIDGLEGGLFSLIHAATRQMKNGGRCAILNTLGLAPHTCTSVIGSIALLW